MSNLGLYQVFTKVAKKVGGPLNLALILIGSGVAIGVAADKKVSKIKKRIENEKTQKNWEMERTTIYTINTEARSNEGLLFKVGDKFRVIERDGDAVLIEKIGDNNNPYFVAFDFLKCISDYSGK